MGYFVVEKLRVDHDELGFHNYSFSMQHFNPTDNSSVVVQGNRRVYHRAQIEASSETNPLKVKKIHKEMSHLKNIPVLHLLRTPLGSGGCQDLPSGEEGRAEPVVGT